MSVNNLQAVCKYYFSFVPSGLLAVSSPVCKVAIDAVELSPYLSCTYAVTLRIYVTGWVQNNLSCLLAGTYSCIYCFQHSISKDLFCFDAPFGSSFHGAS